MTILHSASNGVRALKAEALSKHNAKEERFYLKCGSLYLHESGLALQSGSKWAWSGTMEQARACRAKFDAAVGCITIPVDLAPLPVRADA